MITVRQLMDMRSDNTMWSVSPKDSVYRSLELMAEKNVGAVLVVENGQMVGIFTERDYARKIILMGRTSLDTPIEDIMTKDMVTIDSRADPRRMPGFDDQVSISPSPDHRTWQVSRNGVDA